MKAIFRLFGLTAMLGLSCGHVHADQCSDGLKFVGNGNYASAMKIWENNSSIEPKERLRSDIECLKETKIAPDDAAAAKWIVERAQEGTPNTKLYAGMLYIIGIGVKENDDDARKWVQLAVDAKEPGANHIQEVLEKVIKERYKK